MGMKLILVLLTFGGLSACDKIENMANNGRDPEEQGDDIRYSYIPTLAPEGLWITNASTGSTTHCKVSGDQVTCSAYASGAGEEPSFRYNQDTEEMEPLNQAARISQIYEKYGLKLKPEAEGASGTMQLEVGDIRDCKQLVNDSGADRRIWVELPRDKTGTCVPPPPGFVLQP